MRRRPVLRALAGLLLALALVAGTAGAAAARGLIFTFDTPISGDVVPVTVFLSDAPGGDAVDVELSLPAGEGDLLGVFGNVVDEALVPGMAVESPDGLVTQWQLRANRVRKVGGGNTLSPVTGWDWGVKLGRTGSADGTVEQAAFRLTGAGLTVDELTGAAISGWVLGVRAQSTAGSEGSTKLGLGEGVPPDVVSPTVAIEAPAEGAILAASPAAVSGTVTGTVPAVDVNGTAAAVSSGSFSASVALVEGANTLTATASNAAGTATDSVAVTLDTTPPTVTIDVPADGTKTAAPSVTVSGTVADASPIASLEVAGQAVAPAADGSFSAEVALAIGENAIAATATDAAGNVGSASVTVVRGEPPTVTIDAPAEGALLGASPVAVSGSVTGTAPVSVSVNGTAAAVSGGSYSAEVPLAEGAGTLTATATNDFGTAQAEVSVTLDTTPPSLAIDAPAEGAVLSTASVEVSGTVSDASGVASLLVAASPVTPASDGSFAATVALDPGANTIVAQASDTVGNTAQASVSVSRDAPPELSLAAPADGSVVSSSPVAVSGTTVGADAVQVNGSAAALAADGSFSGSAALAEGPNTVTVVAENAFGSVQATRSVVLDTVPPVVTILAPTDGAVFPDEPVGVFGAVEDATAVSSLALNGEPLEPGSFFATTVALVEGTNPITVVATDAAGNEGSASISVQLDPNAAPVLDPIGDHTVEPGSTLTIELSASDADGDPVTFSVAPLPLPENSTFSAETGVFRFAPTTAQVKSFELLFRATDGIQTDDEAVTITVPEPDATAETALEGRVLDAQDAEAGVTTPIEGATVRSLDSGLSTTTATDGTFRLAGLAAGEHEIEIDGSTAAGTVAYASFRAPFALEAGVTRVVERPFFLPRLDPAGTATVDPTTTTVVENTNLDVRLEIPAHTAKAEDGSDFTGEISVSEVPPEFTPGSLPDVLEPGLVITVQPMGVRFASPVPIRFPNRDGLAPGNEVDLWSLDHDTGRFFVSGTGQVTADGAFIETVDGGVRESSWHAALSPATANVMSAQSDGEHHSAEQCLVCEAASKLVVPTGAVRVDVPLPAHHSQGERRETRLVYRSDRAHPAPLLPFEPTVLQRGAVPPLVSHTVEVGGAAQGAPVFYDTSGLSESQDEPLRLAAQVEAAELPTGVYPVAVRVTSHYAASRVSSTLREDVVVQNGTESPFGAGWGLAGLEHLHVRPGGKVLLASGSGDFSVFEPRPALLDLSDWTHERAASGSWELLDGGLAVRQRQNSGFNFFVSPFEVIDETIRGDFRVQTTSDDDWLGFVVGYRRPVAANGDLATDLEFLLFDWRQRFQRNFAGFRAQQGMSLARVNGDFEPLDIRRPALIAHEDRPPEFTVLGTRFGPGTGWDDRTTHTFEVSYGSSRVRVVIDGEEVFDIPGTFPPGRIGFYSFSQPFVRYRVFADTSETFFDAPEGDFSELVRNADGSFTRTLEDGTRVEYDAQGRQTARVDPNGNTTAYTYDTAGRLVAIIDPVDLVTSFEYEGGLLRRVVDPAGRTTRFEHDADGNLLRVVFPDGTTRSFGYDRRHLQTVERDARGATTTRTYDFAGRFTEATLPDGTVRQGSPAQAVGLVDPASGLGTESSPAQVVRPAEATSTLRDGTGAATVFETGRFGAVEGVTDPTGLVTQVARDADGNPTRTERPSGDVLDRTFDARGNLLSVTDRVLGGTTQFTYEPSFNNVTSMTDARGETTTLGYDIAGNLTSTQTPLGRTTSMTRTAEGQVATLTDPLGTTTGFTYDAEGRLTDLEQGTATTAPRLTRFAYDAAGDLTSLIDPQGRTTSFQYDEAGRVTEQTLPDGSLVAFGYDEAGNLTSLAPPGQPAHHFVYDARGRETAYVPPEVGAFDPATRFAYDAEDRLTGVERPDGKIVSLAYDPAGRLEDLTGPRGVTDLVYDPATGLLDSVTTPNGHGLTFTYTGSRPIGVSWSGAVEASVDWTLDADGRLTSRTVAGGPGVGFAYDADGLLTGAGALTLSREAASGLLSGTSLGSLSTSLSYDPFGERASDAAAYAGTELFANDYVRDALGRIVQETETLQGTTTVFEYAYDANGRLVEVREDGAVAATYTYDANGNRLARTTPEGTETGLYDAQDRLLEYDGTTYTYTENGELTSKTTSDGRTTLYDYDVFGNLRRVDLPDGRAITYEVDGQNRRIARRENGAVTRAFVYGDPLNPVAELADTDGDGTAETVTARFVYASKAHVPDYMVKGGTTYRLVTDHLGSVRLVVDVDTGTVAQRLDYDEFGRVTQDTSPGFQPFGYAGGIHDPDTGLVRFGARDYNPRIGRWTAADPLRLAAPGTNLFTYALSDPLNTIDPDGEASVVLIGGAVVLSAVAVGGGLVLEDCIRACREVREADDEKRDQCGLGGSGIEEFESTRTLGGCLRDCATGVVGLTSRVGRPTFVGAGEVANFVGNLFSE